MSVFDRNFDAEIAQEEKELMYEMLHPKKYSQQDVDKILAEYKETIYQNIFDEGFQAGVDSANKSKENELKDLIINSIQQIREFNNDMSEFKSIIIKDSTDLINTIFIKVLPDLYESTYEDKLKEELQNLIFYALGSQNIKLDVCESELEKIKELFFTIEDSELFNISFNPNPELASGEFNAYWDNGKMQIDLNELKNKIFNHLNITLEKEENNE